MIRATEFLFWLSIGLAVYTYAVYPAVLLLLAGAWQLVGSLRSGLSRRESRREASGQAPFVSLVFPAHNEEAIIEDKIRNCLALDYPRDRLEILAGCDGCDDRTAGLAAGLRAPHLRLFEFPRAGKPVTLNRLVPQASGGIVVFSDANTMLAQGALRAIVRHFANPEIGCVCGRLQLTAPRGASETEGLYWRYETFLKSLESRLNMLVGANGGIFAIRRELFTPLPDGTIIDDFLISMRIRARGFRVVYDAEAAGCEEAVSIAEEFRRRVRIGAGNLHALRYTWRLLSPAAGLVAFSYWSHKICRWLVPLALPAAFVSAVLLAQRPVYAVFAALAACFVLMAWIGYRLERRDVHIRALSIPYYFLSLNLALLLGFVSYLFGRQKGVWTPTAHPAPSASPRSESGPAPAEPAETSRHS